MEPNLGAEFFEDSEEVMEDPLVTIRLLSFTRQFEDACNRVKAIKNANKVYSFKPFRFTECIYKHTHPMFDYPFVACGHRVVVTESHLYCLGTFSPADPVFHDLWRFNFASSHWKSTLHGPNDILYAANASMYSFHGLAAHYNTLICYGGNDLESGVGTNTTRVFTTGANAIAVQLEVAGDIPVGTIKPGTIIYEENLYVIGGQNRIGFSCDVYRLNLSTRVWFNEYTSRGDIMVEPEGRSHHELSCDGEYIFVLGGGTAGRLFSLEKVPAYNMERKDWASFNTLPDQTTISEHQERGFPVARKYFAAVQRAAPNGDMEVYITGGRAGTALSEIWRLNLRSKQWTLLEASLPKPMFFYAAALTQSGCLYIFGGYEVHNGRFVAENTLYKMWLAIPPLSEICWESITHYNLNLNAEQLLDNGVPQRFVERLPLSGEME